MNAAQELVRDLGSTPTATSPATGLARLEKRWKEVTSNVVYYKTQNLPKDRDSDTMKLIPWLVMYDILEGATGALPLTREEREKVIEVERIIYHHLAASSASNTNRTSQTAQLLNVLQSI